MFQFVPATIIKPNPAVKSKNISASRMLMDLFAPLNSFQIKTPQNAPIIVAPWPNPKEMASPAFCAAKRFNEVPKAQINPPIMPDK